jgi:murein DD-endopeptidase MepM/ murein hydrolase activator NlpD
MRNLVVTRTLLISLAVVVTLGASLTSSQPAHAGILSNSWVWPVDAPRAVTREYRAPASTYGSGHRGLDIAVANGQLVRAPAHGRVLFAGLVAGRAVVTLDHGGGVVSTLTPVEAVVGSGTDVLAGDQIGVISFPGTVWDDAHVCSCLHLGARYLGQYVSPRVLLERARPSVLKPWGDGPSSLR